MEDVLVLFIPIIAVLSIFVFLPGLLLHHITKWRTAKALSSDDERMLEDLWRSARLMERRIESLERLIDPEDRPLDERGYRNDGDDPRNRRT
ncbi:MAG: envelope stress response membrane protein PspB [Pseudomonadota bacterium]